MKSYRPKKYPKWSRQWREQEEKVDRDHLGYFAVELFLVGPQQTKGLFLGAKNAP